MNTLLHRYFRAVKTEWPNMSLDMKITLCMTAIAGLLCILYIITGIPVIHDIGRIISRVTLIGWLWQLFIITAKL